MFFCCSSISPRLHLLSRKKYLQVFQKLFHCGLIYYLYYLHTKKCSDFRLEKRREGFRNKQEMAHN